MKFGDEPMFKNCRNLTNEELGKAIDDSKEAYKKMEGKEYIKKLIKVKAIKIEKGVVIPNWFISEIMKGNIEKVNELEYLINDLDGFIKVKEGDYVIKDSENMLYSCKGCIFEEVYEEVVSKDNEDNK